MVYKGQEVKVQSARVLDPLDDSSREVESLEGKARANLVADSHDFKPPQEKIKIDDRMAEIVGQPVELKKPDGSVVQLDGGFVSAVSRGDRSVSIQYHRDDNNEVKLNAQGKPIIDKITIRTRGIDTIQDSIRGSDSETVIDFTKGAKDNGVSELAKHLRVVQSGDNIGDVMIASADNKKIKTLHTNFSTTTSEVVVVDAKDVVRIKQLVKDDGSSVRYNYNDLEQPFKYNQVIEQYQASNGSLVSKISDRIGGSEKFVTHGKSGENPTWRTDLKQMDDGRLAYKELSEKFFDGPKDAARDGGNISLAASRQNFIKVASSHGVFAGDERTIRQWMDKFEDRQQRFRDKHWKTASLDDISECYQNLSRVFTDQATGKAANITKGERRLAVESELKELGNPLKYINQGPVGTCGLNSVEDSLAQRRPEDLTRWMREALTRGHVTSRGLDSQGKHRVAELSEAQLHYQPTFDRLYSNQLFQFSAMAALGYHSDGRDFPGTTDDQINYVGIMAGGKALPFNDTWQGSGATKQGIIAALAKSNVAYIVPGHAMAICDYDPKRDMFLVNNWWGGQGDGWYSPNRLRLR